MKKIISLLIIGCSLLIFGLYSALFFIDYNAIYQDFIKEYKLNFPPQNIHKVKINKFPLPYLSIETIKDEGKIELQNIEVEFSLKSLAKFKPEISSIKILNGKIYYSDNHNISNHDELIAGLFKKEKLKTNIEFRQLNIFNFSNNIILSVKDFYLNKDRRFKGTINNILECSGEIIEGDNTNKFQLIIKGNNSNLVIEEDYDKNNKLIGGNVHWQINNLSNFISNNLPQLSHYFSNISTTEIINIKLNIVPTENSFTLKNVDVASDSILGKGEILINKNNKQQNIVDLNFTKIDLNTLLLSLKEESKNNKPSNNVSTKYNNLINKIIPQFIFTNNLMKVNISVDQIYLTKNEELKKLKFVSQLDQEKFSIRNFSGTIGSGGEFIVVGEITHNLFRNVFDGKVYLRHNNINNILNSIGAENGTVNKVIPFVLTGDLKTTLIDVYLQNILLNTENIKMTGSFSSKFIGATPRVRTILNFSSMDIGKNEYPIISPLLNFTTSLFENMKSNDYLSKFTPIRTISYLGNFDITFNDLNYNNNSLGKVNLLLNAMPGQIKINNLYINNGKEYISTSLNLIASGLKPEVEVVINDGLIYTNYLTPRVLFQFREHLLNNFSIDKIIFKIDCTSAKIYQNNLEMSDLKFNIINENILFKILNFEAKLLSGSLKAEGSILLEPYTLNFVYALNSINLEKLSQILPNGLLKTGGRGSINGMLTTTGNSLENQLYNLFIKSSLVLKNIKINNFSIDSLIETIGSKDYNLANLQEDLKLALLTGETAVNNFQGDIELSKGNVTLKNISFQTNYSSASLSAVANIYNFGLNLTSVFSFYPYNKEMGMVNKKTNPLRLNIKAEGSIFQPQKTADFNELLQALQFKNTSPISPTSSIMGH